MTNNGAAAELAALTYLLYDGTATKSIVLSLSDTVIGSSKLRPTYLTVSMPVSIEPGRSGKNRM